MCVCIYMYGGMWVCVYIYIYSSLYIYKEIEARLQ